MEALISADAHLYKTPDGKIWTDAIYCYDFWLRYLQVFDSITVVARMRDIEVEDAEGMLRSDGKNVSFMPLPMARSAREYFLKIHRFVKNAHEAVDKKECAIIRLPSYPGMFVYNAVIKKKIPFAIEIVADPSSDGKGVKSKILTRFLKKAAIKANGVSYVTKNALQKIYPSYSRLNGESELYFDSNYSSIILNKNIIGKPRFYSEPAKGLSLVHVANAISYDGKGHSIVIQVVHQLMQLGYDVKVDFIGDGILVEHYKKMAENLGISDRVHFLGRFSTSQEVTEEMKRHDLFIFPSKSEGLPRSLIEAMAIGLPCLSTPVGGIPELLSDKFLFDPDDVNGFTYAVKNLIDNPHIMEEASKQNIAVALEYEASVLQERRNIFFSKLKKIADKRGDVNNETL